MKPIIVVGMARSGTTFLSRALSKVIDCPVIVEPHMLWKHEELPCLNDDSYTISYEGGDYIRKVIEKYAKGRSDYYIEKSPINLLRPYKVHSVFPDAYVIFVRRNDDKVIKSNMRRNSDGDQFSFKVFKEKFISRKGGGALAGDSNEVYVPLRAQIARNRIGFLFHSLYGLFAKKFMSLPFGPKVSGWSKFSSFSEYYENVLACTDDYIGLYERLFGDSFFVFEMDRFNEEFGRLLPNFMDEEVISLRADIIDEVLLLAEGKNNA